MEKNSQTNQNTDQLNSTASRRVFYKRKNGTTGIRFENHGPSKTDPSFKDDCDVNQVLKRFMKTGTLHAMHQNRGTGVYADVSEVPDLHVALNQINKAQEAFNALPSDVRKRFGNSIEEMTNFVGNPKNIEESVKLGLLDKTLLEKLAPPSTLAGETAGRQNPQNKNKNQIQTKKQAQNDDNSNDDE